MIIYRTTNLLNGKTYIGMDTNNNPSYYGSGIWIVAAIKKYGKKNFRKETVEEGFKTEEDLCAAEVKYIALERQNNLNGTYNIHDGGTVSNGFIGKTMEEIFGVEKAANMKSKISATLKSKGIKPPSRLGMKNSEKQREAAARVGRERQISAEEIERLVARTIRPIICIQNGTMYKNIKDAAKSLALSKGNICSVLKGNRKHTKGLTFRYLEKT